MKLSYISLLLLTFLTISCRTTSPNFSPVKGVSAEEGVIYIFNSCWKDNNEYATTNSGPKLYINDIFIGHLQLNTYVPLVLEANKEHKIKVTGFWNQPYIPDLEIIVNLENNEEKYLEYIYRVTVPDENGKYSTISEINELKETSEKLKVNDCQIQVNTSNNFKKLHNKPLK